MDGAEERGGGKRMNAPPAHGKVQGTVHELTEVRLCKPSRGMQAVSSHTGAFFSTKVAL